jgi:deoxyadenosine/deoxycytidine kinase
MERNLLVPQVVIRLDASPKTCIKRLRDRLTKEAGRECEVSVSEDYLNGLKASYEEVVWPWFEQKGANILKYNWEEFEDVESIVNDIRRLFSV